jgi:hypothetical protein
MDARDDRGDRRGEPGVMLGPGGAVEIIVHGRGLGHGRARFQTE